MHDPGHLILRRAVRVSIVLPLTYVLVAYGLNLGGGAAYAAFGTFALLAFADFGGPTRDRAGAYLLTGAAGLVAITIGTLAATTIYTAVLATLIVGFVVSYSGVLRGYVAVATTSVLLPFIIAVTAGAGISPLPQRLAAFAVAVVISTAAALILWPVHVHSALRLRVSAALQASANVLRATTPDPSQPTNSSNIDAATRMRELTEATHHVREEYAGRILRPGSATARDRALMQLVDELNRFRLFFRWRVEHSGDSTLPVDYSLAQVTAATLDDCAAALTGAKKIPDPALLDDAREQHRLIIGTWATQQLEDHQVEAVEAGTESSFQLRLISLHTELMARNTRVATGAPPERTAATSAGIPVATPDVTPWSKLRAHLRLKSPWFRNSLRTALALAMSVAVVEVSGVQHGFWVVLGTLTALRFDALGTGRTAVQAIIGVCGGFLVGTGLLLVVGDHTPAYWVLLPIVTFLSAYTPGAISLIVGQGSFTVFVIVFYGLVAGPQLQTGEIRVVDVAIGLSISLIVSALMWPRGVVALVRSTMVTAVHSATSYVVAAYDRLLQGESGEPTLVSSAQGASQALEVAHETFDLAICQSGPAPMYAQTWSAMGNAADQLVAGAQLIGMLAHFEDAPIDDPLVAALMTSSVHSIQTSLNMTVDKLAYLGATPDTPGTQDDPPTDSVEKFMGNPFPLLREAVTSCLSSWNGRSPSSDRSLGEVATSLIWAQEWLIYLNWLAYRTAQLVT